MEKIGIVGASGQLGASLMRVLDQRAISLSRNSPEIDSVSRIIWAAGTSNSRCTQIEADAEFEGISTLLRRSDFTQIHKVVLISSGGTVYGSQTNQPRIETDPLDPQSPYAVLKIRIEDEFRKLSKSSGFSLMILRLANVFSSRGKGLVSSLLQKTNESQPLTLFAHPDSRKQYGHSEDYARLIIRYLDELPHLTAPQIYNLYSPISYSVREIIGIFEKVRRSRFLVDMSEVSLNSDSVELASVFPDFIHAHNWISIEDFVQREIERYKE